MINESDLNEITLDLLVQDMPDLNKQDLMNLISNLQEISDQKTSMTLTEKDSSKSLKSWMPKRQTIKEILYSQVKVSDLPFCIEDFKTFAETKGWSAKDNLDAKLIGHIKIMLSNSKIVLEDQSSEGDA